MRQPDIVANQAGGGHQYRDALPRELGGQIVGNQMLARMRDHRRDLLVPAREEIGRDDLTVVRAQRVNGEAHLLGDTVRVPIGATQTGRLGSLIDHRHRQATAAWP